MPSGVLPVTIPEARACFVYFQSLIFNPRLLLNFRRGNVKEVSISVKLLVFPPLQYKCLGIVIWLLPDQEWEWNLIPSASVSCFFSSYFLLIFRFLRSLLSITFTLRFLNVSVLCFMSLQSVIQV